MRTYTPGPWRPRRALKPIDGEYDWGIGARFGESEHCIAEVFGRVSENIRPNAEANANLIAAAPDLLESLTQMVLAHPKCSRPIGAPNSPARRAQEEQERAIDQAKAAIARATRGAP